MKTITNNVENEIIIKNSKFIALIIKLENDNIKDILSEIKTKYPKATHYCYGYSYYDKKYSSDDNEPTGTAGLPILNVIEKENLSNILIVVVRYFGGIKLGAGGLIRAYTKAVTEALKKVEYKELVPGIKIRIEFDYSDEKQMNYILKNSEIVEKDYHEQITYIVNISKELEKDLTNYNYQILEDIYIEKK